MFRIPKGHRTPAFAAIASSALVLIAAVCCQPEAVDRKSNTTAMKMVVARYADLAFSAYSDSLTGGRKLLTAVDALVNDPSQATLDAARAAWLEARIPYLQTEVFRFYGGPIDRVELLVNTWPIDENYIEDPAGKSGIIDDEARYPVLTTDLIASINMTEGETSVSTGYHAIEFLLWGRDTNDEGPGNRPFTDFARIDGDAKGKTPETVASRLEAARRHRRASYLKVVTELLVRHLSEVTNEWAANRTENYRSRFEKLPPSEALGLMIKGMGALGSQELAGERLTVAYETKDQENEHSSRITGRSGSHRRL